ncbi:MAG TPA: NUDIX domain-containing protein [Alphaproteobacteria bacterium]|nr:NUDIX domain-containing protein [Alphaproteobacteria bacterium]
MAWHHRFAGSLVRNYRKARGFRTLGVRGLVLDRDDRIALVLHTYLDDWYLPGGGVIRGESYDQALARELREEIGLKDFRIERVLGVYHDRVTLKDDHVVVFVVRTPSSAPAIKSADPFEIQDARWFSLDTLPADISPATARRITEYRTGVTGTGAW